MNVTFGRDELFETDPMVRRVLFCLLPFLALSRVWCNVMRFSPRDLPHCGNLGGFLKKAL